MGGGGGGFSGRLRPVVLEMGSVVWYVSEGGLMALPREANELDRDTVAGSLASGGGGGGFRSSEFPLLSIR